MVPSRGQPQRWGLMAHILRVHLYLNVGNENLYDPASGNAARRHVAGFVTRRFYEIFIFNWFHCLAMQEFPIREYCSLAMLSDSGRVNRCSQTQLSLFTVREFEVAKFAASADQIISPPFVSA
jgi:hypothetical protein